MKYYITFGDQERIYNASNPFQACMFMLKDFLIKTSHTYMDAMPVSFRVSQIGFSIHDEDEVISSEFIVKLQLLSNQYKK